MYFFKAVIRFIGPSIFTGNSDRDLKIKNDVTSGQKSNINN